MSSFYSRAPDEENESRLKLVHKISNLITDYLSTARASYRDDPESMSNTLLTVMELWMTCDIASTASYSLLRDYQTGFRPDLLQSLVLPKLEQMERLRKIESHLDRRASEAKFGPPWESFGTENVSGNSFAVRFFDQSPFLKKYHDRLLFEAEQMKKSKLEEIEVARAHHSELMTKVRDLDHKYVNEIDEETGDLESVHQHGSCEPCLRLTEAEAMFLNPFPWPLPIPNHGDKAKAEIFELWVPEIIRDWRYITLRVLVDVFGRRPRYPNKSDLYYPRHPIIDRTAKTWNEGRFRLAQTSHHRERHVARHVNECTDENMIIYRSWSYGLYDQTSSLALSYCLETLAVPPEYQYPPESFPEPLRSWAVQPAHDQNKVLASQSECPEGTTLEEFRAAGTLRSVVRLQWHNILSQLAMPMMPFSKVDTFYFLMQAANEAGPPPTEGSGLREAHAVLSESLCAALYTHLMRVLSMIGGNWEADIPLAIILGLGTRLASIAPPKSQESFRSLLGVTRRVALGWARYLVGKKKEAGTDEERLDLSKRIFTMSLICYDTFDIGISHLTTLLEDDGAIEIMLEAAIVLSEVSHLHANEISRGPFGAILFNRSRKVAYSAREVLQTRILQDSIKNRGQSCLDKAIRKIWERCPPTGDWRSLPDRPHILYNRTVPDVQSQKSLDLRYNILTGDLAVDGAPLSNLPPSYMAHKSYRTLFGSHVIPVGASTRPGMRFCVRSLHHGNEIHFGMHNGHLVVLAVHSSKVEYWLVPSEALEGDVPKLFVTQYTHWLNIRHKKIEFRPLDHTWTPLSPGNLLGGAIMQFERELPLHDRRVTALLSLSKGRTLVNPRSTTATRISAVLSGLEEAEYVHLHFTPQTEGAGEVSIELPRHRLGVSLSAGTTFIRSKQPPDFIIDEDQNIGTLWGLQNKLVLLKNNTGVESSRQRIVIIPHGNIISRSLSALGHSETAIEPEGGLQARHSMFRVDEKLGRLDDSGVLLSRLLLCHLHAVTTHCLPDKLTGRTGTEEALRILSSAALLSFNKLDEDELLMLIKISRISPTRFESDFGIQQVTWGPLAPISHHDGFAQLVHSITNHAMSMSLFYPKSEDKKREWNKSSPTMILRHVVRNSAFRLRAFDYDQHTEKNLDREYDSRDRIQGGVSQSLYQSSEKDVYRMARLLAAKPNGRGKQQLDVSVVLKRLSPNAWRTFEGLVGFREWEYSSSTASSRSTAVQASFDIRWLRNPAKSSSPEDWRKLLALVSRQKPEQRNELLWLLAGLTFAERADHDIIQILLVLGTCSRLQKIPIPTDTHFLPATSKEPAEAELKTLCYRFKLDTQTIETAQPFVERFAQDLMRQWPCVEPREPSGNEYNTALKVTDLMHDVRKIFRNCHRKHLYGEYLNQLKIQIEGLGCCDEYNETCPNPPPATLPKGPQVRKHLTASDLFEIGAPDVDLPQGVSFRSVNTGPPSSRASPAMDLMRPLMESLERSSGESIQAGIYVDELKKSLASLQTHQTHQPRPSEASHAKFEISEPSLKEHLAMCHDRAKGIRESITNALNQNPHPYAPQVVVSCPTVWPRITPMLLLEQLSRHRWPKLDQKWKKALVAYAISLVHLQRAERLVQLHAEGKKGDLLREAQNPGHTNWDPMEFPESLLIEVESNIVIRDVQAQIAMQMQRPPESKNAVMQLSMGEGKSSVIVPIVAAALADGKRLVRIVVGKAQSQQMMHSLVYKLGGLLGRRVYKLPFSREMKLQDPTDAENIRNLCGQCQANGGVLLMQPEHILSFKLMGIESIVGGRDLVGRSLLRTQGYFDTVSRDIIDESDDNLDVRFELTYTIGSHSAIEFTPYRWLMIENVLEIVQAVAEELEEQSYGQDLKFEKSAHTEGFSKVTILNEHGAEGLAARIVAHIQEHGLPSFPEYTMLKDQPPHLQESIFAYIQEPNPLPAKVDLVEAFRDVAADAFQAILLLRGLCARGILCFALEQKRWRVNYGLDSSHIPPTGMAVPYRAKDSPAPRSEFSHPDLRIILTYLSYYYGGLGDDELFDILEHLISSPEGRNHYVGWVRACGGQFPSQLVELSSVNAKDRNLCIEKLFPFLRYHRRVINYYLAQILFPKEMYCFNKKLTSSGWDIAKKKTHVTTGFSGTIDSRLLLPLDINPLDEQQHTNALILSYILMEENQIRRVSADQIKGAPSAAEFYLDLVANDAEPTRVILDVGAQLLELDNLEVAKTWLKKVPSAEAAIFVNSDDQLMTVTKDSYVQHFVTSTYFERIDLCLVFLDQAHTRGIDLRLPENYRAAVLLGPSLSKDTLVQACMRMRKLGKGQSVTFFIPPEIGQKILVSRERVGESNEAEITIVDILRWSIHETWEECRRGIPLWASQGIRFIKHEGVWDDIGRQSDQISVESATRFLDNESQTLEQRYQPIPAGESQNYIWNQAQDPDLQNRIGEFEQIRQRCDEFGIEDFGASGLDEEQERELMVEVEAERLTTKVERQEALPPRLHDHVRSFVVNGEIPAGSDAFVPAFMSLSNTTARDFLDPAEFGNELLVTRDFHETVKPTADFRGDKYLRPVQWVATAYAARGGAGGGRGGGGGVGRSGQLLLSLVIMSPFEVGELLEDFARNAGKRSIVTPSVTLHLYAPRISLGHDAWDELRLFTLPTFPPSRQIPHRRALQLILFSGQLYIRDYDQYRELCKYLGLPCPPERIRPGGAGRVNGNAANGSAANGNAASGGAAAGARPVARFGGAMLSERPPAYAFKKNPVPFIKVLMVAMRNSGKDISGTDMGKLLAGQQLGEQYFAGRFENEAAARRLAKRGPTPMMEPSVV